MKNKPSLKQLQKIFKAIDDVFPKGHPGVRDIKEILKKEDIDQAKNKIKDLLNNHQFPSTWGIWHTWHQNIVHVLEGSSEARPDDIKMPEDQAMAIRESWLFNAGARKGYFSWYAEHSPENPIASSSNAPAPLQGVAYPPAFPPPQGFWQQQVAVQPVVPPRVAPSPILLNLFASAIEKEAALFNNQEAKRCVKIIRGVVHTGNEWYMGQVVELILAQYCNPKEYSYEDVVPWVDKVTQRIRACYDASKGYEIVNPTMETADIVAEMPENVGRQMAEVMMRPEAAKQLKSKLSEIPLYFSEGHWRVTEHERKNNGRHAETDRGWKK